ncbi:MAG: glycosyltransferase family 4 protein, partial [Ktedonobacterales bacterium]
MAQLLFVTQYYPPEVGADQTHLGETATRLVKLGHQVTVLTTLPNYPLGIVPQEYRDRSRRHEIIDGVRVIRVWSHIAPNKGFLP